MNNTKEVPQSQYSAFFKGGTWMTLCTYCCSLISSLVISTIAITPAMVSAETILPNDLSITKTLSGTVYPGATVETIINYHNSGPTELSGISITDSYSQYLSFDSVVVSNPDITVNPVEFSHDVALKRLTWNNISLGTGANGQIILRYIVSNSLPENTDVFNAGSVGISCVSCQDPYTVANTGFSVGYVNPRPITPPDPYDLGLSASLPQSTYTSGDFIDITLDISNDTYSSGNVMLEMVYKTFLMEFVGIVNSGTINFPTANATHPNLSQNSIYYLYNNGDTSKVRRHGFAVPTGTSQVVLRFKMINDYTTPINVDFNLGIPDEYNLISTIGETNNGNNTASISVQGPEFDLWTTTTILTGDEGANPGTYSASGTVTVRVEFGNNGPARDNIILMNDFNSNNQFISYTGDRNYGVYTTRGQHHDWNSFQRQESWGGYRSGISLGANETGYIDVTYRVHECGANTNRSRISIIDNYKTQLQFSRPWQDNYITTRARETNDTNNVSDINVSSDGVCIGGSRRYDQVIGEISSNATGDITPGQIVTFTVPWTYFHSNLDSSSYTQLYFDYSPWMSFVGLSTGVINSHGDTIDEMLSPKYIDKAKQIISKNSDSMKGIEEFGSYSGSREDLRIGILSGFALNECNFSTFPTGRPNFDNATLGIFQYQMQVSGFYNTLYANKLEEYMTLGYNITRAHLSALVDTQTAIYEYSYTHDGRDALRDRQNLMMECEAQSDYLQAIQGGSTTGQAETIRQNVIDEYNTYFTSQDSRIGSYNICGGGDMSIINNNNICQFGWNIEQQYYITGSNLEERVRSTINQTLSDAYATSLGVSGFQQLLGQRLAPYYDTSKPLVRQYHYNANNNQTNGMSYCPTLSCTQDQYQNGNQWIYVDDLTYDYFIDQYLSLTGTNQRLARSGGYVDLSSIPSNFFYNSNGGDLFIDSFSTTGGLAIGVLGTLPNLLNTIQLQFLIGEAPVSSPLSFEARLARGIDPINPSRASCRTYPGDGSDNNRGCLYYDNYQYNDTYSTTGGNEGDIILGDDNVTGIVLTMGYREPYDLTTTKTISQTGEVLPGELVDVTTTVCNNGTGRSDINLSEDYLSNMVFFGQQVSTLGVSYTLNTSTNQIIRKNITLAQNECKSVTTTYTVQPFVTSGSQLIFNSVGGSLGAIMNANTGSYVTVTGAVTAPAPIIYSPYGNKEIVSSTFFPGDEIIYRINYSNPGSLTGIMNLYDMYESGLIFSGIISSSQGLSISSHNLNTRIITWSGVIVEPYSSHSIELSFIISTGKNAFETIRNNFTYDMTFIPDSYIADADKSNNNSNWKASYSLNTFKGYIQHDTNNDGILDSSDKPLSGLEVQLIESGAIMATTLSDGSGGYLFTGMRPGIYTISYTMPAGYIYGNTLLGNLGGGALTTLGLNMVAQYNTYSVNSDGTVSLLRSSVQPNPPSDGGGGGGGGGSSSPICGNTIKEGSEQCDGGSMCTAFCTIITPICSGSGCNPAVHNAPTPEPKKPVKLYPIQEEIVKDEDIHMVAPSFRSFPRTGVN